jgi:two-component system response regulator YesN
MNVIIVDDEPIIRIGLRSMLDWESSGLTLIGEAEDGSEAWRLIEEHNVDLIITDLLMPRMDGLELLRNIKQNDKDVITIVLSCLDDFGWVKEAMKLGAKDYILKPTMEPDQLLELLVEAKRELAARRFQRDRVLQWQQELELTKQAQLTVKLQAYLVHDQPDAQFESELFGKEGAPLLSMLLYMGPVLLPLDLDYEQLGYFSALRVESDRLLLLYSEDCLRVPNASKAQQLSAQVEHILQEKSLRSDWFIMDGPPVHNLNELKLALAEFDRQIQDRFYGGSRDNVLFNDDLSAVSGTLSLPYEHRNDLLRSIVHGNIHGFQYLASELGMKLAESRRPVNEVKAFVTELLTTTIIYAKEHGYSQLEDLDRVLDPVTHVRECASIQEINQLLNRVYGELGLRRISQDTGPSRTSSPFIRRAIQFMRGHYHRNISTADIAEHVKLSRSYLSDLYSKETGESLSETLMLIRMEEAKKKLRSGEMKIYEIAEAVGFPDGKTFAKAFKRLEGCSPKEYESSNK